MDELQEIINKNPLLVEVDVCNIHPMSPSSEPDF